MHYQSPLPIRPGECVSRSSERVLAIANFSLTLPTFTRGGTLGEGCFGATPKPAREDACPPQSTRTRAQLFAESLAESCAHVFAVELRNEAGADLGGTHCFALVSIGAIAESFGVHRAHHFQHAPFAFGSALRQKRKVRNFRSRKKHCRSVRARSCARAAADARRCLHCQVCVVFGNEN
jgi:hypothetical protein